MKFDHKNNRVSLPSLQFTLIPKVKTVRVPQFRGVESEVDSLQNEFLIRCEALGSNSDPRLLSTLIGIVRLRQMWCDNNENLVSNMKYDKLAGHILRIYKEHPGDADARQAVQELGDYLIHNARYREAMGLFENLIEHYETDDTTNLEEDQKKLHFARKTRAREKLMNALSYLNMMDDMREQLDKVLDAKMKMFGPDHPSTAITLSNMAYRIHSYEVSYQRNVTCRSSSVTFDLYIYIFFFV